jgi:hypothetical protein
VKAAQPTARSNSWVPAGNLFLGDNSNDSRHQSSTFGLGFVPVELVVGRVIATFPAGGE